MAIVSIEVFFANSLCGREERIERYDDPVGGQMWYRLYLPDAYDPNIAYPLTTFLHGGGGANVRTVVDPEQDLERAPANLVESMSAGPYDSIIIAPQLERGNWRSFENDRLIRDAIESVQSAYETDPQRRYVTGLSFGGFGTFHMLHAFPEFFAAGAPIAGFYPPPFTEPGEPFSDDPYRDYAEVAKQTPIWAFHGSADIVVPVEETRVVIDALRAADADVRYSELPAGGHNVWDQIYDANDFPSTVIFQLAIDTNEKTFEVHADVDLASNLGLQAFTFNLVGADSVQNLAPKVDVLPTADGPLGFTRGRSADDQLPVTAGQSRSTTSPSVIHGFGQFGGSLAGTPTGTGEVQPKYEAPLLLAQGTFSDLDALDFSAEFIGPKRPLVTASVIAHSGSRPSFAIGYTEILHDGQLVDSRGEHGEFYPWLFSQRRIPEPSTVVLIATSICFALSRRNRLPCGLGGLRGGRYQEISCWSYRPQSLCPHYRGACYDSK